MKKNEFFINLISIFVSFLIILINNVKDYNIKLRLVLYLLYFGFIIIFSIKRMKGLKNCFFNINFIYGCVFLPIHLLDH